MNTLSWLLYVANAAENVGTILGISAFCLFFGYGAVFAAKCMHADIESKPMPKFRFRSWIAAVICALVACFIPSSKTVYMIAASEVGARVADTAEAREMLDLLRNRVRDALTEKKGDRT